MTPQLVQVRGQGGLRGLPHDSAHVSILHAQSVLKVTPNAFVNRKPHVQPARSNCPHPTAQSLLAPSTAAAPQQIHQPPLLRPRVPPALACYDRLPVLGLSDAATQGPAKTQPRRYWALLTRASRSPPAWRTRRMTPSAGTRPHSAPLIPCSTSRAPPSCCSYAAAATTSDACIAAPCSAALPSRQPPLLLLLCVHTWPDIQGSC